MKVIKETKTTQQFKRIDDLVEEFTWYQAEDGKLYKDEPSCIAHEKWLHELDYIPHFGNWYYISNEDDFNVVCKHLIEGECAKCRHKFNIKEDIGWIEFHIDYYENGPDDLSLDHLSGYIELVNKLQSIKKQE
jgi:hypothetical protein